MRLILSALVSVIFLAPLAHSASGVRISKIEIIDDGSGSGGLIPLVDTTQDVCSVEDSVIEYEPFYNSVASVTVINRRTSTLRITDFWYQVEFNGSKFVSTKIPPSGISEIAPGKTGSAVISLFLNADGGGKYFTGSSSAIAEAQGPTTITFFVRGRDGARKRVRAKGRMTVQFSNYDRCPE